MPKKFSLKNARLPITFSLLSALFYLGMIALTTPEKLGPLQGYGASESRLEGGGPLPFYWLERAPTVRSRYSIDGAARSNYFLRSSGLPDPESAPRAFYVVEEGVSMAMPGRGGGGGARGGQAAQPAGEPDDGDLPAAGGGSRGGQQGRRQGEGEAAAPGTGRSGNEQSGGERTGGRTERPGGEVRESAFRGGGQEQGGARPAQPQSRGESAPPAREQGQGRNLAQGQAPAVPPRAFSAKVTRDEENKAWLISMAVGLAGKVTLYVESEQGGKRYLTAATSSVRNKARDNFMAPEELPVPSGLPALTAGTAQGQLLSFPTNAPVVITLAGSGFSDRLMFADMLHRSHRWLELAEKPGGGGKQSPFVEEFDARLNRAGMSAKAVSFVARDENGGTASFMFDISRDSTRRNYRAAGFATAALSFAGALVFALAARSRFKAPNQRGRS